MKIPPTINKTVAELVGIILGDGHVSKYQVSITLDMTSDKEYAIRVSRLCYEVFGVVPTLRKRPALNCVVLTLSSVALTRWLNSIGIPCGDKLKNGVDIPDQIKHEPTLFRACARGLFDTDGSIYLETHTYKDRKYSYPRMMFTSASPAILDSFFVACHGNGILARRRGVKRVAIEPFTDIKQYFRIIGSSNQKHLDRFTAFGGVG